MKKTAVSVRRNIAKKLTNDDNEDSNTTSVHQHNGLHDVSSSKDKLVEEESEEDDVFTDALDTLSLKHSLNGGVVASATTPPRPFEDTKPQNFMLNRFLPAAKSMTLEQQQQTHYASKRRPVRQIRDIVRAEEEYRATPKRYDEYVTTSTTPSYFHDDEDESDDEDEANSEYISTRGCGMMSPQLCFKNSLGVLSSVHHGHQVKSSKVAQLKSRFQSVKKLALDYKQKLGSRGQSPVHSSFGKKFNFGSEQLETNTASRPSSPYRQTGCMSPYRSVGNVSPLHPAGETRKEAEIRRANRLNKHIRNNKSNPPELLYPKSTRLDSSTSSFMEKTLHVDDIQNCPKTRSDKGNLNVRILPETVETVSKEPKMAGDKPKIKALTSNSTGCDMSSLPPPLPKKPSESWLFRNLPSRSYLFHPSKKNLQENSTSVATKWETIVKTSCIHNDHIRYSEELVARSSCQSLT